MQKTLEHGEDSTRDPYAVEVGRRLARARAAAGLTQTALAQKLKVSPSKLSNWENGIHMLPPQFIPTIFLATRIDSNYLYLGDSNQLPSHIDKKLSSETLP